MSEKFSVGGGVVWSSDNTVSKVQVLGLSPKSFQLLTLDLTLDLTFGLDFWTGLLDLTFGLDFWT